MNHILNNLKHNFANIQIGYGFLSVLKLGTILTGEQRKTLIRVLIQTFVLKVMNNEGKKLIHYEFIDRIAEQTASVII